MGHPTNRHIKNAVDSGTDEILNELKQLRADWQKHIAITELLGIDLKCPHCDEVLYKNE